MISVSYTSTGLTNRQKDAVDSLADAVETILNDHLPVDGTPTNSVAATGLLTMAGTANGCTAGEAIDGETVTIGTTIYEFDTDGSVVSGHVAVDISTGAVAAQGKLTVDTQPIAGDTMSIGRTAYVFVANGLANVPGEISVGTNLAGAKTNIVAAINGTDGFNVANPLVSAAAFSSNDCTLTARVKGTQGNSIPTVETFTAETNIFNAATLGTTTAGDNMTAANQVLALIAAAATHPTVTVAAVNGQALQVGLTAKTAGTAGNSIATTDTLDNGSFGAATLTGGVSGTPGKKGSILSDSSYIYVAMQDNTVASAVWKKSALSTL